MAWRNKKGGAERLNLTCIFSWFAPWFVVASALRAAGVILEVIAVPLRVTSEFLIVVALTAIGLSSDLRRMKAAGARPLLLGLGVWMSVVLSSLYAQYLLGSW